MLKTRRVVVTQEGRDKGKTFLITEKPADQAERWFLRALFALLQSRSDISTDSLQAGAAGIARIGLAALAGIPWETAEPLLAELMECVRFQPPRADVQPLPLTGVEIEEVTTLLALRMAVLELHVGFSLAESSLISESSPQLGDENQPRTPTLLQSLAGWFQRALRRS